MTDFITVNNSSDCDYNNSLVKQEPISVISSKYCLPHSIDIKVDMETRVMHIKDDENFNVKVLSLYRRVLYDESGNPIFTLYKKKMTAHGRYKIFEGDSTDSTKLLFSVKRPSIVPYPKNLVLNVFRAGTDTKKGRVDFTVRANGTNRSCTIYAGDCSRIIATMEKNDGAFSVSVRPNVDYAFLVALFMIVYNMQPPFTFKDLKVVEDLVEMTESILNMVTGCVQISQNEPNSTPPNK